MTVKMGYMLQKEERRMGGDNVSQDQTSIICIDLKSFYASVECVERGLDPFKANLVVADPTRSKSTICLAITPAMKSLGIKNRCRIHEIPDCVKYITAMPRMQLYMIIPQRSMESICGTSQKKISMCTVSMSVLLM